MTTFGKTIGTGVVATLLLAGLTAGAQALGPGGGMSSFGGESRSMTQIKGSVVCVGCTLDEVREAQPNLRRLYKLRHAQGQVVMQMHAINEAAWWESIVGLSHRISARAPDRVFQQLTAEENLFKEMEVTGLLRKTGTFDIGEITVLGPSIAEEARAAGERAQAAAGQAEAAAARAEGAAAQAEGVAERVERTVQRIVAMAKKLDGRPAEL
jgi:hypothetical protein